MASHVTSRPISARATRTVSVAVLAVTAMLTTGCVATASGSTTEPQCVASATPFAELAIDESPRTIEGPSTACLADAALPMIDSDETPQLPATVTDDEGVKVTVTDASRILPIDVSGSLAATVFGLGLGDRVVGRDSSTGFAEASALPVVTQGGHNLTAEAILALDPTVVITDTTLGPLDVLDQLRDSGIPVVITTSERSLDTIDELIDQVATALGVPERGGLLAAQVDADLARVTADIGTAIPSDVAVRPRIAFLYVRGSANVYYLFGAESGADSLIESIGGIDIASEIGWEGMRPVTAEALVAAQPDVVLLMSGGLESAGGIDGLLERVPALASTPAGLHRRFVDMADSEILSFGPRAPQVVEALARAVWAPEQSGYLDD